MNGKRNNHQSKNPDEIIRIEGGIPQIISDELWERVQKMMDARKISRAACKAKEIYLLSGLIFCGKCEGAMVGNCRTAGKTKSKYYTYECSLRKRTKECDCKAINKAYVEDIVINEIEKHFFSDEAIKTMSQKLYEFAKSQSAEISADIARFEKNISKVQVEINNLINAIAAGMFHPSMKEKMDTLEAQKAELERKLTEARIQAELNAPSEEAIIQYLSKEGSIKEKSPEDQKRIIQAYVQKVIVHQDYVDVKFIVDFTGGGGAYRFESTIDISEMRRIKAVAV